MTRSQRYLLAGIAVALTLGCALQARQRQAVKERAGGAGQVNDFDRWLDMVPAFLDRRAEYVDDRFPTPPITIILLAPFTALAKPDAQKHAVVKDGLQRIIDFRFAHHFPRSIR